MATARSAQKTGEARKMGCSGCCKESETKVRPFKEESDEEGADFHGPIHHRECRDILFLIIFLAFIVGMGVVAVLGIMNGNPLRIVYGYDSWGNVCNQPNRPIANVTPALTGIDMTGKTKLFYLDPMYFMSMIPDMNLPTFTEFSFVHICVASCPDNNTDVLDLYSTEGINLCRYDVTPYENDLQKCPNTPVQKHVSMFNRCVPETVFLMAKAITSSFTSVLGKSMLGSELPQKILSDLKNTWKEILYLSAISVGVSLIIVVLMRFLAAIIVWTLVIGVIVLSIGASAYCWASWYSLDEEYNLLPANRQTEEAADYVRTWMVYSIIATVITVIILLILLVMRKRIALVVQLYFEAGQAIAAIPLLLLQPIWTLLVLVICLAVLLLIAAFIETSGLPNVNPVTGFVKYQIEGYWHYVRWYHIFGILWLSAFIVACQDLIIAGAVAKWYFSKDKKKLGSPICNALWRLVRYHLGSVALGSLIIALVRLARIILAYIQKKLQGKAGKITDFILKVLQCCLWCFERFLRYLNRNAYIEIAIYGYNFCASAKKAFFLILDNALRVAAINSIGDFVLFLGKISTVAIVVVIGREFLRSHDDINYIWVPISVAGAFAFAISHCFLLVYEITIDTIFLCFCEDCERNDGVTKPYFMSKNLMKYLEDNEKVEASIQKETKTKTKI